MTSAGAEVDDGLVDDAEAVAGEDVPDPLVGREVFGCIAGFALCLSSDLVFELAVAGEEVGVEAPGGEQVGDTEEHLDPVERFDQKVRGSAGERATHGRRRCCRRSG